MVMNKIIEPPDEQDEPINDALDNVLTSLRHAKELAIGKQQFELAAWLREEEFKMSAKLNECKSLYKTL